MRFDRRIAFCVIVLGGLGPAICSFADQLEPPRGSSSENSKVRWIRKAPKAPLPITPTAPLPAPASLPRIERREARLLADPDPMPIRPPRVAARRGQGENASEERPRQSVAPPRGRGMTLAEAEQIALANNPTLVQAAMRIRAAEGKCLQVGLYPNPILGYEGDEMGASGTAGQQGAFVTQEFVTAGKLRLRSAVAGHEVVQAESAGVAQQQRVLNDVRAAWYEVLVAQRILELNQELVRIGQEGVKAAAELLEAMEVSRVDLLQARIEAESTRIELHDAQDRYRSVWKRLAALLGTPEMQPVHLSGDLEGDLPRLTWKESLGSLLAGSPELTEARAGVQRARCAVARERAERIPNIRLRAGVRYHHPEENTVATVEVGLPLPIFDRNQGNIYKAEADLVAAEKEVKRVELVLRERLAVAFQQYASARHRAQQYAAEILPNAKASLDLVQAGYRHGEHDYLTLLTAQRTFFQVNLAYLESLLKYRASDVAIKGFLLAGGLEAAGVSRDP